MSKILTKLQNHPQEVSLRNRSFGSAAMSKKRVEKSSIFELQEVSFEMSLVQKCSLSSRADLLGRLAFC